MLDNFYTFYLENTQLITYKSDDPRIKAVLFKI